MIDEREPGKPLGNTRHERFAQARVAGMSATGAYEDAGYEPNRSHASRLDSNGNVAERVEELLEQAALMAVDASRITKDVVLGLMLNEAVNCKSDSARVMAIKTLGQTNVVGLFVSDDENNQLRTVPEIVRSFAGDNDELYRMLLAHMPLSPSEKAQLKQ